VDKDDDRIVRERTGDHPELTKLVIGTPRNQVHMLGQSKFRIEGETQITNCEGKGDMRKEQSKLGKVNTLELSTATQPNKLRFGGV
jgi:hypothetical protein